MRNERIAAAWDGILPDKAAEERMLSEILAYRRSRADKRGRLLPKRVVSAAACLVIVFGAVFLGLRGGLFAKDYTCTLPNGRTVVYAKGSVSSASADVKYILNAEDEGHREFGADEFHALFPTLEGSFYGGGVFSTDTGELLHIECWIADEEQYFENSSGEQVRVIGGVGQLKICASREGLPLTDCIVSGKESETEVNGVPLKTGYSVSDKNSRGRRTAIFFAEYVQNGTAVYAELAGDSEESTQIAERLTKEVCGLIESGSPDLKAVKWEQN